MNKSQLIKKMMEHYPDHSLETITKIITSIFTDITNALVKGEKIEIRRFGSFSLRKRIMNKVINPRNKNILAPNDVCTLYFRASKEFKKILNE